ncbi:unnamed protein product [Pleuronectes platessa]|uniref:Uncharacterized protein n=1 Tax=Pleuronectes platessa TaxID=8262 RepID=A0A9N7Z108_PLEPL|nr:unnamed protein product [Pleuronectes platessa]
MTKVGSVCTGDVEIYAVVAASAKICIGTQSRSVDVTLHLTTQYNQALFKYPTIFKSDSEEETLSKSPRNRVVVSNTKEAKMRYKEMGEMITECSCVTHVACEKDEEEFACLDCDLCNRQAPSHSKHAISPQTEACFSTTHGFNRRLRLLLLLLLLCLQLGEENNQT